MASPARPVALPDEAPDVTATEDHNLALNILFTALGRALQGRAAVVPDVFVRVDEQDQAAPDLMVVPGVARGGRTVYRIPGDPVPSVTIEVISPANRQGHGRAILAAKRSLFARIGVGHHLEVDPARGLITAWEPRAGRMVAVAEGTEYTSEAIGGVRIATPAPGQLEVWMPNGHRVLPSDAELARADEAEARASEAEARATHERAGRAREQARATQAEARERAAEARADALAERLRQLGLEP
ncbi:MAG: Uma2 family endonuclease [Acidimicrobiales bacterium]